MSITTECLTYLTSTVAVLRALVETLLAKTAPSTQDPLTLELCDRPVDFTNFSEAWRTVFQSSGTHQPAICRLHQEIVHALFTALGDTVATAASPAVEAWLRSQTPQFPLLRPRLTCSVLWFVAALHNWLWYYQREHRRIILLAASKVPPAPPQPQEKWTLQWLLTVLHAGLQRFRLRKTTHRSALAASQIPQESHLERHIDAFLGQLLTATSLEVGDLISMHLLATKLRACVTFAPLEPVPGENHTQVQEPASQGKMSVSQQLKTTLDTMSLFSPLSRLTLSGTANRPALQHEQQTWPWLDRLFKDLSAASVRQYCVSQLGSRLLQPLLEPEQVADILQALQAMHKQLTAQEAAVLPGVLEHWYMFLADMLWATIEQHLPARQHDDLLWSRWCAGYPEYVSLAQWLGRLAYRAEEIAGRNRPHQYPELVWRWGDLARAALNLWISRPGYAVLCLGLWLEGYCHERDHLPPLTVARRLTDFSLEQLVAHWESVVRREGEVYGAYDLSGAEQKRLLNMLEQLSAHLARQSAYALLRPEPCAIPLASSHNQQDAQNTPAGEDSEVYPIVKIIQYA